MSVSITFPDHTKTTPLYLDTPTTGAFLRETGGHQDLIPGQVFTYQLLIEPGKYYSISHEAGGFLTSATLSIEGGAEVPVVNSQTDSEGQPLHPYKQEFGHIVSLDQATVIYLELEIKDTQSYFPSGNQYTISYEEITASPNTDGDDLIEWSKTYQLFVGGDGFDTLSYQSQTEAVSLNLGYQNFTTRTEGPSNSRSTIIDFEKIVGTDFDDIMIADYRNNTFGGNDTNAPAAVTNLEWSGGKGDDVLGTSSGVTIFDGGEGTDTATYQGSSTGVDVSLLRGRGWAGDAQGDQLISIENLVGSYGPDTLTGDHGDNVIRGRGLREDILMGNGGNDTLISGESLGANRGIAVFSGARDEYIVKAAPASEGHVNSPETWPTVTVEHVGGTGGDGTDLLIGVGFLKFADQEKVSLFDAIEDDHANTTDMNATAIQIGETTRVIRSGSNDIDVLRVSLEAGKKYVFDLTSVEGFQTPNTDFSIQDSDGNLVRLESNRETATNSPFANVTQSGEYFIVFGSTGISSLNNRAQDLTITEGGTLYTGTSGNDTISLMENVNFFDAGDGIDTFEISSQQTNFVRFTHVPNGSFSGYASSSSENKAFVLSNFETLFGSEGYDTFDLSAQSANSSDRKFSFFGLDGNDRFHSGVGATHIDGGEGFDKVSYTSDFMLVDGYQGEGVRVNLTTGTASGGIAQGDTLVSIESIHDSPFDDHLTLTNENNLVTLTTGEDTVFAMGGNDTIYAGDGNLTIVGGAGDDTFEFTSDNGGGTFIYSGDRDEYSIRLNSVTHTSPQNGVDDGTDRFDTDRSVRFEQQFADQTVTVIKSEAAEAITGTFGIDFIKVTEAGSVVTGGHSDDRLIGAEKGSTANYRYISNQYEIHFDTSQTLFSDFKVDDILTRNAGGTLSTSSSPVLHVDYVGPWSGDGNDLITDFTVLEFRDKSFSINYGTNNADTYVGKWGRDIYLGDGGDDIVTGGSGADILDGGHGMDTAVFRYRRAEYDIREEDGRIIVNYEGQWTGDGSSELTNFEQLQFSDQSVLINDLIF